MLGLALSVGCVAAYVLFTMSFWPVKKTVSKSDQTIIELAFNQPIAAYTFPRREPDLSEESGPDMDMRIALARQEEKVEGLKQTVEREFARMAEALGKHADAVNNAFSAMKNDFVSKSDNATTIDRMNKLERVVYGACGVILLGVVGALVALVLVKP